MALVSHSPEKYRHKLLCTTNPNPKHDFSILPLILSPPLLSPLSLSNHVLYFTFQADRGACGYLVSFDIPNVSICDATSHNVQRRDGTV